MALSLKIQRKIKFSSAISAALGYVSWLWDSGETNTAKLVVDKAGTDTRTIQVGRCYLPDGTDDFVDVGNVGDSIKSICFRIKASDITSHTDYVLDLNGTDYVTIVNGTVTLNGFAGATTNIYVDGSAGSSITNITDFHNVIITSDTGFTASDLDLFRLEGTGYCSASVYDIRLFTSELSSAERTTIDAFGNVTSALSCWYKCDEQAGSTSYDSNGGTNNGTITNATLSTFHASDWKVGYSWQNEVGYTLSGSTFIPRDETDTDNDVTASALGETGRVKYDASFASSRCATFDGTNDFVNTNYILPGGTTKASVCAWVKIDSTGDYNDIVSAYNGTNQIHFRIDNNDKIIFGSYDGTTREVQSTFAVSADTWYHVVGVYDGTDYRLYIDGSLDNTSTDTFAPNTTHELYVGARNHNDSANLNFDGDLMGVGFWTTDLSSSDVSDLYNSMIIKTTSLQFLYPLAEGTESIIYDVSSNGQHGTATNITEGTFWANTQDKFHYNITKGFSLYEHSSDPDLLVPYDLAGAALTITAPTGYSKTTDNPSGQWHNGAESKIVLVAAPALFKCDVSNFFFNTSGVPISKSYSDLVEDVGGAHKIMMDVSVSSLKKNLLLYEEALTGDDLTSTQSYLNHL